MKILDGKILQKKILDNVKKTVSLLDIKPKLFVILVEKYESNFIYLRQIKKMCDEVGFECESVFLEAITEFGFLKLIDDKNTDPEINGILILGPLPFYLDDDKIYNCITPIKDVEGIGITNQLKIITKDFNYYPCTAWGIISLFEFHNINVLEKKVVILNRSKRIGKPLFYYFLDNNCTVTMLHSKSKNYESILKDADIVITAVGKGTFLDSDMFKEESIVVDLGMYNEDGKIEGDVYVKEDSSIIYLCHTGGVGPVTIACLAQNILKSYYLSHEDK